MSKLRKKGEAVLDPKYEGKKGSRAALYADTDDEDEGEEEDHGMNGFDEEEDEDEDEMGDFEDLEANGAGSDDESIDSDGFDGEGGDEDAETEDEAPARPARKVESRTKQQDERSMVSQLKQAATADVEKGRDVKKQLVRPSWRFFSRRELTFLLTGLLRLASRVPHQAAKGGRCRQPPSPTCSSEAVL